MRDTEFNKVEENQIAKVNYRGHNLNVEIYEIENNRVYFKTINPTGYQPTKGYFNRIETERYLTITHL